MQDYFQRNVLKSAVEVSGASKGPVIIGNGVWIGDSVIVLSGVRIGNGAVIGAGSVVTRSIPEYAVAVGSPARVIRYRFPAYVRERLQGVEWWRWDKKKMIKWKELFEIDLDHVGEDQLLRLLERIEEDEKH